MPPLPLDTLHRATVCLAIAADTLEILANGLKAPFLEAISDTTQALLKNIEVNHSLKSSLIRRLTQGPKTVKHNRNNCIQLMEQTNELLNAIIILHIEADTGGGLAPTQQRGGKVKMFFRREEMSTLLKDCSSQMSGVYSGYHNSSNSISMLPSEPKIFYGRESELANILKTFNAGHPRIAILGAGGMGKTTLARVVLHHQEIVARYQQHRFFVACESAATKVELAALIGAHLGLKPGEDLTRPVVQHFTSCPPSLLVLDNLETSWEVFGVCVEVEEFLSLLTDVKHLALIPLEQNAARQTFRDIADGRHDPEEVDKVLSLTDNMPLAINLVAHLADSEGCLSVLLRWETEKTDVELIRSKLPISDVLGCKVALIRTALAYKDEHKQLKALVPVREYMHKIHPPQDHLIRTLLLYFKELLEVYEQYQGIPRNRRTVSQISLNMANIQNILRNCLQKDHPDLKDSISFAVHLNIFRRVEDVLPHSCDHRLQVNFITELFGSLHYYPISNPETLIHQALEHFEQFDDPDLKSLFYIKVADYLRRQEDCTRAIDFCQASISLEISTGNTKQHSDAMHNLACIYWHLGDYSLAQLQAYQAQRLAKISGDLYREARALQVGAMSWRQLGNYKHSGTLCHRAGNLLVLCGMANSATALDIMASRAEIHKLKSEYNEAYDIHIQVLQQAPVDQDSYSHACTLVNMAEIGVPTGMEKDLILMHIKKAKAIFQTTKLVTLPPPERRRLSRGKATFEKCLKVKHVEKRSYCLERLADVGRWGVLSTMFGWTTIFLVHSLKFKKRLGIHKGLKFLGDVFLAQNDEATAINLYTVTLEGFTLMDVHCSRAECMLQLGDIFNRHGDLSKAVELWETARALFKRSSQAKQVEQIDEKLANVGEDVLEKHRKNMARLAELN
ncbi:hypothetical protein K438DRAFT_1763811 [Mycena galopus ATCC 62051]|nr:hypothetical protein K438DRAFT_1763811 [Mycena galopus ATCC 62051]